MKIFKTKKIEVTTEIEITFPFYTRRGDIYYSVIDKDIAIEVTYRDNYFGLCLTTSSMAFLDVWEEITQSEFKYKFNEIKKKIVNL